MQFINDLIGDFKNNFLKDIDTLDIILVMVLIVPLIMTFTSKKIAEKFKNEEKEIMNLSLKIKSGALILLAILALIITQV